MDMHSTHLCCQEPTIQSTAHVAYAQPGGGEETRARDKTGTGRREEQRGRHFCSDVVHLLGLPKYELAFAMFRQ